jgi:hypothetical protein
VGKEYFVFAITIRLGHAWYYIADEDFVYYPILNPASLFEIVDGRVSSYWNVGLHPEKHQSECFIVAFPEWANDPYFYDKLTDRNPETVAVFEKYRRLMDDEQDRPLAS